MNFNILVRENEQDEFQPMSVAMHLRSGYEVWVLFNGKSYFFLPNQLIELAGALEAAMRVRKL